MSSRMDMRLNATMLLLRPQSKLLNLSKSIILKFFERNAAPKLKKKFKLSEMKLLVKLNTWLSSAQISVTCNRIKLK